METTTLIQQLYLAYYGRPADPNGLAYWVDRLEGNGGDLGSVISAFATSGEFDTRFGGLSQPALINNLYQQLFGRAADDAGLAFYTDMLARGDSSLIELALDIANGAQDDDSIVIGKRTAVAQQFTQDVAERGVSYGAIDAAAQLLNQVTATTNVTTFIQNNAKALVDQWAGNDDTPVPSTPTPPLVVLGVMEAVEKLQSNEALPARYKIVDSAEHLLGAINASGNLLTFSVQDASQTLAPSVTLEALQAVLKGADSIDLTNKSIGLDALKLLITSSAMVITYGGNNLDELEQFLAITAKFDLSSTTIIGSVVEMLDVGGGGEVDFTFLDLVDLVNADGYHLADSLANILAQNSDGSALLANADSIIATDVANGAPLTLETVTENTAGTTLNLGGDMTAAYVLSQTQLMAIDESAVINLFDGDLITVTGVTTIEGRFEAAEAIALLDDNDTLVLADQAFLTLTAAALENLAPALTLTGNDVANLLITDIANGAQLAATSLIDTFDVSGLLGGQSATINGLQTGDKIAVDTMDGLLDWSFSPGALSYDIMVDSVTSIQVQLVLTGIGYLQYADGVFTVDNSIA